MPGAKWSKQAYPNSINGFGPAETARPMSPGPGNLGEEPAVSASVAWPAARAVAMTPCPEAW
jgi:hypothetical protein